MEERFIYCGTKKMRCGYTTGSCAAAAAKAAAEALLTGQNVKYTEILLPKGERIMLEISKCTIYKEIAACSVIKDSGDDPDITNGIEIIAEVSLIEYGVDIVGGNGVGTVTKAGLDQPVGMAAINSVPRKMIAQSVMDAAEMHEYRGGFRVVISVPKGEELAKKTFNPRIGILGGISIIGTTGIVEPMSSSAMIETIRTEANIRRQEGRKVLVLTVGNYSDRFVFEKLPQLSEQCVMCSNFIGDAIDIGITLGFENILICGHIGKLVKLGSGIMNTHSSYADGRIETLIACGALAGLDNSLLCRLSDCATTDSALDILYENGQAQRLLDVLTERIHSYLQARVKGEAKIGAVVFSYQHDMLLKTGYADEILDLAVK
ncbi:cobalt-precorrin-5B (C(1))-methyltransferase CbiD [Ruminococcus sp.]|uniref:cobalt-precorrin-5B (C(1))-methyltransferase CbiD n=1 Tax=Ruminococcus sp. TaxID=41978 RepID=UPI0025F64AFF|nr:cobalt-precorrin-5B (C(1))-methyltransferase CbiD [Ruminococcus sp.]MCR4638123.1 cobalt-precorrin-5B (C(1))-methyltransferase CbiD [Ruminococcus sp.]